MLPSRRSLLPRRERCAVCGRRVRSSHEVMRLRGLVVHAGCAGYRRRGRRD